MRTTRIWEAMVGSDALEANTKDTSAVADVAERAFEIVRSTDWCGDVGEPELVIGSRVTAGTLFWSLKVGSGYMLFSGRICRRLP